MNLVCVRSFIYMQASLQGRPLYRVTLHLRDHRLQNMQFMTSGLQFILLCTESSPKYFFPAGVFMTPVALMYIFMSLIDPRHITKGWPAFHVTALSVDKAQILTPQSGIKPSKVLCCFLWKTLNNSSIWEKKYSKGKYQSIFSTSGFIVAYIKYFGCGITGNV